MHPCTFKGYLTIHILSGIRFNQIFDKDSPDSYNQLLFLFSQFLSETVQTSF